MKLFNLPDDWEKAIGHLNQIIEAKDAKLEILVEALRFYAGPWTNEDCDKRNRDGGFFPYGVEETDQGKDQGKIAMQALTDAGYPPEGKK